MATERGVAIITGASSGIGRALAPLLSKQGFAIGLIARRQVELDNAVNEVTGTGGTAVAATADVGNRAQLRAAIAHLESQLGPTEVMVANAGYGVPTHLNPLNTAEVEATFQINLMGVIYSVEAVLPGMIARKRGQILAISSLGRVQGNARRIGLLRQQSRREYLHGRVANRAS